MNTVATIYDKHMDSPSLQGLNDKHMDSPSLQGLNDKQMEAVTSTEGALLVLAGAGTGKTKVLVSRIAHILETGKAYPSQIFAVTFTNKAAGEMKERVSKIIGGENLNNRWIGTFHSLAVKILRSHADLVGLQSNFSILDTDDQIRLIKSIMEEYNIDTKKFVPKSVAWYISRWKDKALPPEEVGADELTSANAKIFLNIYKRYQQRLKGVNACDFGDLIMHVITIFKNPTHSEILKNYQKRFRYIMVDEYQDTNTAQYLWLRLMARGCGNICCVGDDDQSIYGWRGAEIGNILRFEKDFPGAKIIRLEQNYRSTGNILKAAGEVISCNQKRLGKTLWSQSGSGEKITLCSLFDGEAEARWIGEEIINVTSQGKKYSDIALLVRAGYQMREFEERFMKLGIHYKVIGGQRFYERMEIRDALAYLRFTLQNRDDLALERIINLPKRGVGKSTMQTLHLYSRENGTGLYKAIKDLSAKGELRPALRKTLCGLMEDFDRWNSLINEMKHTELAMKILEESGYLQMWKQDKNPDSSGRVDNLKELISGMAEFDSLQEFLEHVSLVLENRDDGDNNAVSVMTLHGAKGLEFDTVFLPGWEEGLFPSQRSMDENGIAGLEEERRLAYVGITRAKNKAYISHVSSRLVYGSFIDAIPSRFVEELPDDCVDRISGSFYRNHGRSHHWDSGGYDHNYGNKKHESSFASYDTGKRETKYIYTNPVSKSPKSQEPAKPKIKKGDKVTHKTFGSGVVKEIIEKDTLQIEFSDNQIKTIMSDYVTVE